tara:strand:- start:1740 stop:2093 length:354 start_codon:yes stop_codon:yes gene_type:complete
MSLKLFFTWWNKQTFGTFLKTLFTGKYVGKDDYGNKYYTNSKDERWVIYSSDIEATKITTDWFLWMHKTIDKVPGKDNQKKHKWQIDHSSNKTGTIDSYKPIKIGKKQIKKKYDTWK